MGPGGVSEAGKVSGRRRGHAALTDQRGAATNTFVQLPRDWRRVWGQKRHDWPRRPSRSPRAEGRGGWRLQQRDRGTGTRCCRQNRGTTAVARLARGTGTRSPASRGGAPACGSQDSRADVDATATDPSACRGGARGLMGDPTRSGVELFHSRTARGHCGLCADFGHRPL